MEIFFTFLTLFQCFSLFFHLRKAKQTLIIILQIYIFGIYNVLHFYVGQFIQQQAIQDFICLIRQIIVTSKALNQIVILQNFSHQKIVVFARFTPISKIQTNTRQPFGQNSFVYFGIILNKFVITSPLRRKIHFFSYQILLTWMTEIIQDVLLKILFSSSSVFCLGLAGLDIFFFFSTGLVSLVFCCVDCRVYGIKNYQLALKLIFKFCLNIPFRQSIFTTLMKKKQSIPKNLRLLPFFVVSKVMREALPSSIKSSEDAKMMIQKCATEFVMFITTEAIEKCKVDKRKILSAEDMIHALNVLGFERYDELITLHLEKFNQLQKESKEKKEESGQEEYSEKEEKEFDEKEIYEEEEEND